MSLDARRSIDVARGAVERRKAAEKRSLLVLVLDYLESSGYHRAADALASDTGLTVGAEVACDNMGLPIAISQYLNFYEEKYGKRPKLVRSASKEPLRGTSTVRPRSTRPERGRSAKPPASEPLADVTGKPVSALPSPAEASPATTLPSGEVLVPLPGSFSGAADAETAELGKVIQRDIILANNNLTFDSIVGNEEAKQALRESVFFPLTHPAAFHGILQPWKGILLYGPPGTGKTLLAKAVASTSGCTFFNVGASMLVSKFHGQSEKLVRALFGLARSMAPSVIFIDEIDALCSARGAGNEHEASRRLKTEILTQMDGLASSDWSEGVSSRVLVLCNTNLPWDLDASLLRRLEKRIYVPLPSEKARHGILNRALEDRLTVDGAAAVSAVAEFSKGFSGADIVALAKEAAMRPLRKLVASGTEVEESDEVPEALRVTADDVVAAAKAVKPTGCLQSAKYEEFSKIA